MLQHPGVMPVSAVQPQYVNAATYTQAKAYPQYLPATTMQVQPAQPKVAQTMSPIVSTKAPAPAIYQPGISQPSVIGSAALGAAVPPPATQKLTSAAPVAGTVPAAQGVTTVTRVVAGAQPTSVRAQLGQATMQMATSITVREQALERRVRELEQEVAQKDRHIKELRALLSRAGVKTPSSITTKVVRSPGRAGNSGFRQIEGGTPRERYQAVDQDDPADVRLEEFYNTTGSLIAFRRINRGFYRFGEQICELSVINHKLMARTEDGWNRGKFGPIEKFLMHYENIEREKVGLPLEP